MLNSNSPSFSKWSIFKILKWRKRERGRSIERERERERQRDQISVNANISSPSFSKWSILKSLSGRTGERERQTDRQTEEGYFIWLLIWYKQQCNDYFGHTFGNFSEKWKTRSKIPPFHFTITYTYFCIYIYKYM